jgi:hypothetical protein
MQATLPARAHCFPLVAYLALLAGYKCNQGLGGGGGGRRSAGSEAFSKKIGAVDVFTGLLRVSFLLCLLACLLLSSVCVRVSLVVLITLVVTSLHRVYRCTSQVKSSDGREVYHLKMWSNETIGAVMDVLREQV